MQRLPGCLLVSLHNMIEQLLTQLRPQSSPSFVQVEGLLGLFGQRLGPHAPLAAAAVAAVATDMSLGSMSSSAAGQPPAAYARNVTLSERRTYRIPPPVALLGER